MALIAKATPNEGGEFIQVPAGMHLARCYKILDLGTQPKLVQGVTKFQRTIDVYFEVHGEDAEGNPMVTNKGEPMSINGDYNFTLNEASKLTKHLESWRGKKFTEEERKGFDIEKILGSWAMINVTANLSKSNGKTYHNISDIMPVPKMVKDAGLPDPFNKPQIFSFDDEELNMDVFNSINSYKQNKIKESPEGRERFGSSGNAPVPKQAQDDGFNDDIPF